MTVGEPALARAILNGNEHTTLGEVAVHVLSESTAIGLSAGALPKSYWHMDPNEDATMAAVGDDGALLAVADGHNGADVAMAAVGAMQDQAETLLGCPAAQAERELTAALVRVEEAIGVLLAHRRAPRSLSRAALSVALIRGERLITATYGDTAVVRVRAGRAKAFSAGDGFLGAAGALPAHATARLREGDLVVVCSDGVTDFIGQDWPAAIAAAAEDQPDAESVVRALLERAFEGGAGDHLAVAVTKVGPEAGPSS